MWNRRIKTWLESRENETLEFKEAKNRYDFEKLVKYCCAIANEGGGHMVLGINDTLPRNVVGSTAFSQLGKTKLGLLERLHLRIEADETEYDGKRVIIFSIPSRPIGVPVQYRGAYWMRTDDGLVPMTPEKLKAILNESGPDFTAEICPEASVADLNPRALALLRTRWHKKSGNANIRMLSDEQLLADAELVLPRGVTYAALILLGTTEAVSRFLPQSEIILEYRNSPAKIPYDKRYEFRQGFFTYDAELWETINLRNEIQHYKDGFFVWDIPTFNEDVIREAVLNAVSHRDYHMPGSVFIKQFPQRMEITNPGGLPQGITIENMLYRQAPRNRRIAEVFAKCGLVERSGQGIDKILSSCIRESKPTPDFSRTDAHHVALGLECHIQDDRFLRFLEKVGEETLNSFTIEDLMALDHIHRERELPQPLNDRIDGLIDIGVVERVRRGKHMLSKKFYHFIGEKGTYTRKRGLDKETNKALLFKHIKENEKDGVRLSELKQVLPDLSHSQVQRLLRNLKEEGKIKSIGVTNAGRWYPIAS